MQRVSPRGTISSKNGSRLIYFHLKIPTKCAHYIVKGWISFIHHLNNISSTIASRRSWTRLLNFPSFWGFLRSLVHSSSTNLWQIYFAFLTLSDCRFTATREGYFDPSSDTFAEWYEKRCAGEPCAPTTDRRRLLWPSASTNMRNKGEDHAKENMATQMAGKNTEAHTEIIANRSSGEETHLTRQGKNLLTFVFRRDRHCLGRGKPSPVPGIGPLSARRRERAERNAMGLYR